MKRILLSLKTGQTEMVETPWPKNKVGHLLIATHCSLISPGTEKMLLDFGKGSLLEKIKQQPDKVRAVFDKFKTDGLLPTLEAVKYKLDQKLPLGYCNVGTVLEVGQGIDEFKVGDRVVSNGPHAEVVCVPKNLCCKIPARVADDAAALTILGAIALQGLRLATPTLGESFVVIGLGLIGLLTTQLLLAQGCRVLGIDFDENKLLLAKQFGAAVVKAGVQDDVLLAAQAFSKNRGVDGVLIAASTRSHDPVHQAAQMCRKRGRIILIGVTGLSLSRADFYEKELSFQVSCSYGPGRYDVHYEEAGHDYPIGYVRWTEQRNFEAFLELLDQKKLDVLPMITARFPFMEANVAYAALDEQSHHLGMLLHYPNKQSLEPTHTITVNPTISSSSKKIVIGWIGAGNYASRILLPAFKPTQVTLKQIACLAGISGVAIGKKFGFTSVTTDADNIFLDPDINIVVIATRHDTHAHFICRALEAGKHIFVEKPLCITLDELARIQAKWLLHSQCKLMIGFNRRFSPHLQKMKQLLTSMTAPKYFIMTVNAGEIPKTHWAYSLDVGGGRMIGEACHFIDMLRFLTGASITHFHVESAASINRDQICLTLHFEDGSLGVIHYLTNGHNRFQKERLEVFCNGKILQLDNFRKLKGLGWHHFKKMNLWRQDKGQRACVERFVKTVRDGLETPIAINEIIEVSRIALQVSVAMQSQVSGKLHAHRLVLDDGALQS